MPDLDFLVHLPLLRIEQEQIPFGPGQLYRMPFDHYDQVSLGAFSEQRKAYEATEPVFFALTVEIPEQGLVAGAQHSEGLAEIKVPSANRALLDRLGLAVANRFDRHFAEPVRTAILLAAPASGLVPPTWSQTFVVVDGDWCMPLSSGPSQAARIQGEADHEYLFLPDAVSERLATNDVERAANLYPRIAALEAVPELNAALTALRATGIPLLSRQDCLTLCTGALEALLLPEVRSGLRRTFAARCSALLGTDAVDGERLRDLTGRLYEARSISIHGGRLEDDHAMANTAVAQQLLAAAILALADALAGGGDLEGIRHGLDGHGARTGSGGTPCLRVPPVGRARSDRLARRRPSEVYTATSAMVMPEGRFGCWSPLLGLATRDLGENGVMRIGEAPAPLLMPLSPAELIDLEERDIRRDFMATLGIEGFPMAALMTEPEPAEVLHDPQAVLPRLERLRDLAVVALRLAGFDAFTDPELFGSAVFLGSLRLRRPTVLRQTVAEGMRHEAAQRIGPTDRPAVAGHWQRLRTYAGRPSPEVEHVLALYRRAFDRAFLGPTQRAILVLAVLEAMLGRFRRRGDPAQLEDLVAALAGPGPDVQWFAREGRGFRNAVAHGRWEAGDDACVDRLLRLVSAILPALLERWNTAAADITARPSDLLIERAMALHLGTGT